MFVVVTGLSHFFVFLFLKRWYSLQGWRAALHVNLLCLSRESHVRSVESRDSSVFTLLQTPNRYRNTLVYRTGFYPFGYNFSVGNSQLNRRFDTFRGSSRRTTKVNIINILFTYTTGRWTQRDYYPSTGPVTGLDPLNIEVPPRQRLYLP